MMYSMIYDIFTQYFLFNVGKSNINNPKKKPNNKHQN